MAKVIVLGGCGTVGKVAVKTLVGGEDFSEIVIGDINIDKAKQIVAELGSKKLSAVKVDVGDAASVKAAVAGSDVVLNCSGPFYKFVKTTLKAVIDAKINYVDICDDVDVTKEILEFDGDAKKAGITALIGMGSSPGATNLLAKLAAVNLLDETDSIDIYHAHGGEPTEGEGVIGHRFHCMTIPVPMFLDGKLKYVKFFEPDGIALREKVDFYRLGKGIQVYPYPHPEQVTIPMFIKTKRVTNKGTVLPNEYYDLIMNMCKLGMTDRTPIDVKGQKVAPYDFAMAYILRERERILKETKFGVQRGCVKIVVTGKKDGKYRQFVFSLASENQALGEGTGIPAAMGAIMMLQGKVSGKGVLPPEGCLNPLDFVSLIDKVMKKDKDTKSFDGVIIESIDDTGKSTRLNI